jgi:diguanylate cyclase (GGDEF)-like protein
LSPVTLVLIAALGVALLVTAAASVGLRRARKRGDERVEEAVRRATEAFQETLRQVSEDSVAARFVGELAASLDLAEIAERTLDAAAAIPGVDAVMLETSTPDGERVTHAVGLPPEEAERTTVSIPDNDNLRAVELLYRYRIDDADGETPLIRSGLALPMRADGTTVGTLSAFSRTGEQLSGTQLDELERLAFRAGPALENARRFIEARALADLDSLTGLHNRRYFHETLAREVVRARRYGRQLALIVFDLDDFKAINDRIGHLAGDAVLAEVSARMMSIVRSADVACRVGGDEFGVVLPESLGSEAELLASRIAHGISSKPIGDAGTLFVSAGIAELRETDDAVELFERADAALYRAKELGKARTVAANDV